MRASILVLVLAACGGDQDGSGDSGTSTVTKPVPVSYTARPVDGSVNVPPLENVVLAFDSDLDPESVAAATVVIRDDVNRPVDAVLSVDSAVLTIDPVIALPWASATPSRSRASPSRTRRSCRR